MSDTPSTSQSGADPLVARIEAAVRRAAIPEATALAREGLDAGIVHPLLLHLRAEWLSGEGRYAEALDDLEKAKALAPRDPWVANAVGECLVKDDRFADAVAAFDAALAIWPGYPLAHYNRGFALEILGELKMAEESYLRAGTLDVKFADPFARLAGLAARNNDWLKARNLANHALSLDSANTIAIFGLAKADLDAGDFDGAERRIAAVLQDSRKDPVEKATATSILGDIRDAQGRTADAFATYAAGNALFRDFYGPRLAAKGQEAPLALVARVTAYLESQPEATFRAVGETSGGVAGEASGLVFLLGFPRAGTTLLGQILASHSRVMTLEERFPIVDADRELLRAAGGLDRLATLRPAELAFYRQAYWRHVKALGWHIRDKIVVDKLPANTMRLPLVARLFPEAKIVFAIRDPRDVVFSCFRRIFQIHPLTFELLDLEGAARLYDGMMRLAELCRARLPLAWLDIRNEDLVRDFEGETRKLCDFLGLGWQDSLRGFGMQAKSRTIATPSSAQVTRGLSSAGIGQWRRYREQLAPVLPILQPWVEKFGYPAE